MYKYCVIGGICVQDHKPTLGEKSERGYIGSGTAGLEVLKPQCLVWSVT